MAGAEKTTTEKLPGRLISPWLDGADLPRRPALEADVEVDVAVVGAGIIGLTCALLLQRQGVRVVVLEGRHIGAGVTGNTTAKLSSLHGLTYADLISTHGKETARAYAQLSEDGIASVTAIAAELGIECDLRSKPNFTYTTDPERRGEIEREVEAAQAAGLDAEFAESTDLPFEIEAAVRLDGQAQFDPIPFLAGIASQLDETDPCVFERTFATGVSGGRVETATGASVQARRVVVATQIPFLDRGMFFARTAVERSYALTAHVSGSLPDGMFLSADSPSRSLRTIPQAGEELMMIGGAGHELGHGDSVESFRSLERFAREHFEVRGFEHRWGAHDFMPDDDLPFIGRLQPLGDHVLVASGMRKWGLAMGTSAANILADLALGRDNELAGVFDPWRVPPLSAASTLLKNNSETGVHFFLDRAKRHRTAADLKPGEGRVVVDGLGQKAVHRDTAGVLHAVAARCTHLGCIVAWNEGEQTWDCPCHGSRFDPEGEVLNGPATAPLKQVDVDQ